MGSCLGPASTGLLTATSGGPIGSRVATAADDETGRDSSVTGRDSRHSIMKSHGGGSRFGALMPHVQWRPQGGSGGGRRIRKGSAFISPAAVTDAQTMSRRRAEGAVCGLLVGAAIGALVGVLTSLAAVGAL